MNCAVICFTKRGQETAAEIGDWLSRQGHSCGLFCKKEGFSGEGNIQPVEGPLQGWAQAHFAQDSLLVFVGAAGIAVRSCAPFIRSKTTDPAVLCVDERAKFVIPLLSGHIGGANELALRLGAYLGSTPVITTATDLGGLFAVDEFARRNGMHIADMELAKQCSARLLDGHCVRFASDFPLDGALQGGLVPQEDAEDEDRDILVRVTVSDKAGERELRLIPPAVVLGIGCRKGTDPEALLSFILEELARAGIDPAGVGKVCTIDRKAKEEAVLAAARSLGARLEIFDAAALRSQEGCFAASAFVEAQVGVDNVCERSAAAGSRGGRFLIRKTARDGMTLAACLENRRIRF